MTLNKKIGNYRQICSARRVVCTDGKEAGAKLIEVSNGVLNFTLNESSAMDIYQLFHKGMNMSFISRNGLTYDNTMPFLNYFPAGMMYTCGLDCIGAKDGHPMHGMIHHIPSLLKSIECGEDGVEIKCEIRDSALFGECLVIRRTVSTLAGSNKIHIHDELSNESFRTEDYALLYHINVGYPMLDVGAKIFGDIESTIPRDEQAKRLMDTRFIVEEPVDNLGEACYFHNMRTPVIGVINEKIGKKFTVRYSKDTLPEITQWKGLQSGDFVIGLEPTTTKLDNIKYKQIASGETVIFDVEIEISEI